MLKTKRIDQPLTGDMLNEIGRLYPVVYVFSAWPGLDEAMGRALCEAEPGEIAVVAEFDPSGDVCKRFGLSTPQSMMAFAVNCPASAAQHPEEYASAIQAARRWRKRNKAAEGNETGTYLNAINFAELSQVRAGTYIAILAQTVAS